MNLPSSITITARDSLGNRLPRTTRMQMLKLKRLNEKAKLGHTSSKNLIPAMIELDRLCDTLFIPYETKERAAKIYRKALKKQLIRGRSIAIVVAASLYLACRIAGIVRTIEEIAEASTAKKREIARCYRLLLKELKVKPPIPEPETYIQKIAKKAQISQKTQMDAIKIIEKAKKMHITEGKDPKGTAAAALYLACLLNKEWKTQHEIAKNANITEITLRKRYKTLTKILNINPQTINPYAHPKNKRRTGGPGGI